MCGNNIRPRVNVIENEGKIQKNNVENEQNHKKNPVNFNQSHQNTQKNTSNYMEKDTKSRNTPIKTTLDISSPKIHHKFAQSISESPHNLLQTVDNSSSLPFSPIKSKVASLSHQNHSSASASLMPFASSTPLYLPSSIINNSVSICFDTGSFASVLSEDFFQSVSTTRQCLASTGPSILQVQRPRIIP